MGDIEKYIVIVRNSVGNEISMIIDSSYPIDALFLACRSLNNGNGDQFKEKIRGNNFENINKTFKKICGCDLIYFSTIKKEYFKINEL